MQAKQTGIPPVHMADPETGAKADVLDVDAHGLDGRPTFGRDAMVVFLYICGFVGVLNMVGALLAMFIFMLVYLFTFNRGHPVSNLIYSLALPAFLYGLFKILLNASLPVGPFGF